MKYKVEKILIMEGNSRNLYDSIYQDRITVVRWLVKSFWKEVQRTRKQTGFHPPKKMDLEFF